MKQQSWTYFLTLAITFMSGGFLVSFATTLFSSEDAHSSNNPSDEQTLASASAHNSCTNIFEKDFTSHVTASIAEEEVLVVGCGGVF